MPGSAKELKLTLYADDNNSFLTTQQSIVNLFKELQRFEEASGCNINSDKTKGMTLGGAAVPNLPFKIPWNPPVRKHDVDRDRKLENRIDTHYPPGSSHSAETLSSPTPYSFQKHGMLPPSFQPAWK